MTRMVEEQRVTIGGLKALGYSKGAIAVKYVGYGFLASALGSLIGLAVGLTLLPWIICNAWNIIYTLGEVQYGLEPVTSSLACLAAVGTVTLSALGACFSTLTAVPAQLMRPKAPPAGKRVLLERLPFLWRRLSFNYKITIRNLFRYQRRFWMTVVGIGGCAALIVTAFGLRGSIFDIMDKQFDEIYGYTAQVGLVDQVTPGELREVTQALEESELVEDFLACSSQSVTAETDAYTVDATLQVFPSQEALEPFIHLRHRTDSQPVVLPDDGVVLTEKLAKLLGIQAGDTITLDGDARVEVQVADVTEHYIQHYVYMTDACYQAVFGTEPEQNLILAGYPIDAPETEALERELVSLDGVTALTWMEDTRDTYGSSLESVDYAVVLIIVCAAALAFVVLYNLTNINITERMRELATLKVLGFYDRELSAYIYRENVVLTVFGVAMGMVMGKLLHQWLILTVEIDLLKPATVYAVQVNYHDHQSGLYGRIPGLRHRYVVKGSLDGQSWTTLVDRSDSYKDVPNDYVQLDRPTRARYIRYVNIEVPTPHLAISDLRVFGIGEGKKPSAVKDFKVVRQADRRDALLTWKADDDCQGYNIRWGIAPDKLYNSWLVYGKSEHLLKSLSTDQAYYFTIEAFNENGVSEPAKIQEIR